MGNLEFGLDPEPHIRLPKVLKMFFRNILAFFTSKSSSTQLIIESSYVERGNLEKPNLELAWSSYYLRTPNRVGKKSSDG